MSWIDSLQVWQNIGFLMTWAFSIQRKKAMSELKWVPEKEACGFVSMRYQIFIIFLYVYVSVSSMSQCVSIHMCLCVCVRQVLPEAAHTHTHTHTHRSMHICSSVQRSEQGIRCLPPNALPIPLRQGLSLNLGDEGFCWLGWKCKAPTIVLFLPLSNWSYRLAQDA